MQQQDAYNQQGQNDFEQGGNNQYQNIEKLEEGFEGKARTGFIKKVYTILFAQLLITVLLSVISMSSNTYLLWQYNNPWAFILCTVVALVTEIGIFCFPGVARKVPTNYILLLVFTLSFGFMVSFICGMTSITIYYPNIIVYNYQGPYLVIIAAGLTAAMVLGLTVYAMTTKTDFTFMGGMLWLSCFSFMFMGMFMGIFYGNAYMNTWYIFYCAMGVILFGMYLVYDTQLICGKHKLKLSIDDYIIAALILYIDIIQIFLYILEILGRAR